MSIREFRALPKQRKKELISAVDDALAAQILTVAFCGYGKKSWVATAMMIGGGNTPDSVRMIATRELHKMKQAHRNR